MSVSVQSSDGFTITSSADNADQVLADLTAADAAASPLDGRTPAETPTPVETPVAEPAPVVAEAAEEPAEPDPPQPRNEHGQFQSKHKKGSMQYRMDQKTWEAAEARRTLDRERQERQQLQQEREQLRQRLDALERGSRTPAAEPAPKAPDPADKPKLEQFDTYEEFVEAVADWKADQKFKARDEQAQQHAFMQDRRRIGTEFQQRKAEFAKTVADFDEVVNTDAISLSPVMSEALVTSAHGPAIAYYLGKHPEETARLTQESAHYAPAVAAPLMQRLLEDRAQSFLASLKPASSASPAQTTAVIRQAAPAPIKPVGSGLSVADTAPDDLPFGPDYVARMNQRDLDRARAKHGR